ncbi:RNA polymerase sigma factor [Belliella sp. DSM 111904]|uniref:RNA polymerase sigma factor n=1 Tax=Belliella filtrata TaxID=2923435 RepID=A0ABS9V6J3_9BACT|nr:RNA polymerase sigma factor [Belliella filtrata]MCH7411565.1 RNA polymerase sigma factor [Belliella filtrata]
MFGNRTFRNEYEIIEGCRKGDRKAQRFLYDTYSKKFYAICLRYIKDRDLAEDVLVESFMKIFEKINQFESKGSFEGWMKRVIVTHALLTLRSNKNLLMEVNLEPEHEYAQSSYELNQLEAEELMSLVTSLPTGYRTVFNLYVIEGYSHAEIADLLGISESTSKSQLNRSRNLLKQKIAEQELKERRING